MEYQVNSICRDCVFAVYDDQRNQTACQLGRIPLLMAQGGDIKQVYDIDQTWETAHQEQKAAYERALEAAKTAGEPEPPRPVELDEVPPRAEGGLAFYHIGGRLCATCRHKDSAWAHSVPPERRATAVRDEIRVRMHVLVQVGRASLDEVVTTALSLSRQSLAARTVHFLLTPASVVTPAALTQRLRQLGSSLIWKVRHVLEPGATIGRASDLTLRQVPVNDCNYYSVFHAGFVVPPSFIQDIDAALNDRLERFVVLEPVTTEQPQGLVVQTKLHQMVNGNEPAEHEEEDGTVVRCDSVVDKIRLMTRDDEVSYLIKKVSDVCPTLLA